jgi:integrase/recombinase XerD
LEPVSIEVTKALLDTCKNHKFTDSRDRAIILALCDTGARATEFLSIELEDVNRITGEILIRRGKGGKPRSVFLGKKTRKAMRTYLKNRTDDSKYLWVTKSGEKLSYPGLRGILLRRSKIANVAEPSPHDFRRFFALQAFRAGVDIFTLRKLTGHSYTKVYYGI